MSKLTVVNSRWTAYKGKEFESLCDYLEYQAETQAACVHPLLIHLPSDNSTHLYDNWYCGHCAALVINNIIPKESSNE